MNHKEPKIVRKIKTTQSKSYKNTRTRVIVQSTQTTDYKKNKYKLNYDPKTRKNERFSG